jgi:hypothetical protein
MSADTVVPGTKESVPGRGRWPHRPRRPVPHIVSGMLRRDVFGVRLGVLLIVLPIMVSTLGLQLVSRQMWNHPPDSRYYLPMMWRDMGHSWGDSVQMERQVSPSWNVSPWYFAGNDPTWQMVRIRLLYPVLSIPFIWMWGLSGGSMAIPFLGAVLFVWATARVLQRLYGPAVAALVTVGFSLVQNVTGFAWAGTDTLAMGLAAVLVANLPIERRIGKANLLWLGVISVFIALSRQVGVLAPAMAGAGWLWALVRQRTWRNRWLGSLVVTAATTLVIQILTMMLANANTAGVVGRGQTTYWGILRQFIHFLKVVTQEACTYMWHNDRLLYALLIAAGVSVLAHFASDASAVFVGAAASTYLITAGVGFSSYMRYEMIMYPAAAVAAGGLVTLMLGDYLAKPRPEDAEAEDPLPVRSRRYTLRITDALAASAAGRFLGFDRPRADRWKPQLILSGVVLAVIVGVSLPGSWGSAIDAPPSPSFAAAQGSADYAVPPLAKPPAEVTLHWVFVQAIGLTKHSGELQGAFDWTHAVRYRPTAIDQPGYASRAKDGTTLINVNSLGQDPNGQEALGDAISLNGTVKPDTVKVLSRQVSEYGEDVVFSIADASGVVHRGTATTLYPIWNKQDPGVITALVFDN